MGPFPNAHDRVSNITPKAGCQELSELHTTARLEMPLTEGSPGNVVLQKGTRIRTNSGVASSKAALAPTGRPPHKTFPPTTASERREATSGRGSFSYQAQARRDGATLGFPAAFPSLGAAARGIYGATAAAPSLGAPGPPCPFRPALCIDVRIATGNLIPRKKTRLLTSTARSMMIGRVFLVPAGACQFGHGVGGFTTHFIHSRKRNSPELLEPS